MTQAKIVEVIEVRSCRGKGTDHDPARTVTQYFDRAGKWLAESDPWKEEMEATCLVGQSAALAGPYVGAANVSAEKR